MNTAHKIDDYEQQAIDFLESTNTRLDVKYLYTGKHFDSDTEDRDIYLFTLTNGKFSYSANFGDSIHNTERRKLANYMPYSAHQLWGNALQVAIRAGFIDHKGHKINREAVKQAKTLKPNAYDILACLDILYCDTFEEFCAEFGYDEQPITEHDSVMQTFLKCREQSRALNKLFTSDELQSLSEIN